MAGIRRHQVVVGRMFAMTFCVRDGGWPAPAILQSPGPFGMENGQEGGAFLSHWPQNRTLAALPRLRRHRSLGGAWCLVSPRC